MGDWWRLTRGVLIYEGVPVLRVPCTSEGAPVTFLCSDTPIFPRWPNFRFSLGEVIIVRSFTTCSFVSLVWGALMALFLLLLLLLLLKVKWDC